MGFISSINLVIFFLWLISASVDYAEFAYLWQQKEYRLDRFRDFLQTKQGKKYWQQYQFIWRSFFAIVIFLWPLNDISIVKGIAIVIFSLDLTYILWRRVKQQLRQPKGTTKAYLIFFISLFVEGSLFLLSHDWTILFFFLIIRFFILSIIVYLFYFPTRLIKEALIRKATKKIASYPSLRIIGITGSYGKTSTKEFLAHILSQKFEVIRTPKHVNTDIGVARFILNSDFKGVDICIIEMGAYGVGEIAKIARMVKPSIGILTGINEQHLSLFGSIEQIQKTKYELLTALPQNGNAVVNSDNEYCRTDLHLLHCKVSTYGFHEEYSPTLLIESVKTVEHGFEMSGTLSGERDSVLVPIIGSHHALNIAAAITVAGLLKMKKGEILEGIRTIPPQMGSIRRYQYGSATVIDDSYNSNPTGFKAALDVLSTYPSIKKRIVITRGMLELGERSNELHEEIGGEIAFVADELIVISANSYAAICRGIGDKYRTTVQLIEDHELLLHFIQSLHSVDCVVLLENRVPRIIRQEIKGTI